MDANTLKALKWNFTELTEDENPSLQTAYHLSFPSFNFMGL